MRFTYFDSVKSQRGQLCTYEKFVEATYSPMLATICKAIANEPDHDKQQQMKKNLPIITFNAHFEAQRKNDLAKPSGAYMWDGDGIENPFQFYSEHICGHQEEWGIVYVGMTPSCHGLRIVAKCRKEFSTIAECQQWLGEKIGWPCDAACKDWARASYVTPENYIYYMDSKGMFDEEPEVVYEVKSEDVKEKKESPAKPQSAVASDNVSGIVSTASEPAADALQTTYRGIPLKDIAHQWLLMNGGEPVEGQRNDRIHTLAYVMRCITDYKEDVLMAALPRYGLEESEVRRFVHSACIATPTNGMPKSLQKVLQKMIALKEQNDEEQLTTMEFVPTSDELPPLPPLVRELVKIAPDDFKKALTLCLLPLLGTLGSKLRAEYLDGKMHSPSFQVSLEAPQASGKSFMMDISKLILAPIEARDSLAIAAEEGYSEKAAEIKMTDKKKSIGPRPKGIVRILVPTISNTMMLSRLKNSHELHLICVAPEIDSVYKANKQSFSNYNDLLRMAFDNDIHGQDYYNTADTVCGKAKVYLNTLYSGTPNQMRRFYPDVENGLVSRVLFVTLPDQFGKRMPVWGKLTPKSLAEVEKQRDRLDAVSVVGETIQQDHKMNLGFLNEAMDGWLEANRQESIRTKDRTRDTFYRRAAVVGFRAGMLAYFLYGEKSSRYCRKNTVEFAKWVADQMLTQHLLRYEINGKGSNTNKWEEAYSMLGNEFTLGELQSALMATGKNTPLKNVIYKWHLLGCIEDIETAISNNGKPHPVKFRKK